MFNERTIPRTKEEIESLLDVAFAGEGWETIKHGIGWLVNIPVENEPNPYQVVIQNLLRKQLQAVPQQQDFSSSFSY